MSVIYSQTAINDRLLGVVTAIGNNGFFVLKAGATTLSSIQLANPCGTVNAGVLTFTGALVDPAAAATGVADTAVITDNGGNIVISGFSVGITSSSEVAISNGLNSTLISSGQAVQLLGAQIVGS